MAEFSAIAQTINPGESAVFITNPINDLPDFIQFRSNSGLILLSGWLQPPYWMRSNCPCNRVRFIDYPICVGANIAIPTGGTVGEISMALAVDGTTLPETIMRVTPAAVEEYFNISRCVDVGIFRRCCQEISLRNTSDQPILLDNGTLKIGHPTFGR